MLPHPSLSAYRRSPTHRAAAASLKAAAIRVKATFGGIISNMELVERFLLGGLIVSVFAVVGDVLRPKGFAGLFGAIDDRGRVRFALPFVWGRPMRRTNGPDSISARATPTACHAHFETAWPGAAAHAR